MHNPLLVVSAVAALITMIFVPPSPAYFDCFNWHTLTCLLCILMVVSAFDSSGLLEFLAHSMVERVKSLRTLVIVLVLVTLCCSMILSNDMTLVSVLPLAVLLLKSIGRERGIPFTFIVITLTANLGGMLLPFGNPHNLYLYTMFGVVFADFVLLMAPPLVLSMALILLRCLFVQKADFRYRKPPTIILSMPHVVTCGALFALCIAMTVGAISYPVGALVVIAVLALADRTVFAKTDYALVLTFVCFCFQRQHRANTRAFSLLHRVALQLRCLCCCAYKLSSHQQRSHGHFAVELHRRLGGYRARYKHRCGGHAYLVACHSYYFAPVSKAHFRLLGQRRG